MSNIMRTSIYAQNIACSGCAQTITDKLSALENITNTQVDVEQGKVSFDYLHEKDISNVKEQLKNLGYPASAQ